MQSTCPFSASVSFCASLIFVIITLFSKVGRHKDWAYSSIYLKYSNLFTRGKKGLALGAMMSFLGSVDVKGYIMRLLNSSKSSTLIFLSLHTSLAKLGLILQRAKPKLV